MLTWARCAFEFLVCLHQQVWRRWWKVFQSLTVLFPERRDTLVLPVELRGEVAKCLQLTDLAAWSVVHQNSRRLFWQSGEVWRSLALSQGFSIPAQPQMFASEDSLEAVSTFRRLIFRLDGKRLRHLPRHDHHAILLEATHMLRGLLPGETAAIVEELCARAEYALDAHDPGCAASNLAAEHLLDLARRYSSGLCRGVFKEAQIERLERAYAAAQQLHDIMESSMQRHYERSMLDLEESLWTQADDNFLTWSTYEVEDFFDDICMQ